MTAPDTTDVTSALAAALRELAASTTDSHAVSAANGYARLLEAPWSPSMEKWVRRVRDELSNPKTVFADSPDQSEAFWRAAETARVAAQAATNHFVGLRRPDLAAVVVAQREA